MPGINFNERFAKAEKIIENLANPVEIEFGDDTAAENKNAPIKNIYKSTEHQGNSETAANVLEYDFQNSGVLLKCRIEDYGKGIALFSDFLRDAKKYYRKTCINAKFIYFFSYRPMYRELNHEQLCWYLFWRSRVRIGDYIKTGLSYIFLYIFEQINLSDLIGAEKVYTNIINIWKNYREEFPRIDKYISEWLIDFTLINRIKLNLDDISEILPDIINTASLPEFYLKGDFFKNPAYIDLILTKMPAYDYKKSKFYSAKDGKNKDLFDYHVSKILHAVLSSETFDKILKSETADGVTVKATRESFMGAVCIYNYKKKIVVEYKNIFKNFYIRELITNSIRHAENIIRDYLQIKSKLNIDIQSFPIELEKIIKEYKDSYLTVVKPAKVSVKIKGAKKREYSEDEFKITEFAPNLKIAAEIEKSSWETTQTLLELQNKSNADNTEITSFADNDSDIEDSFEAINTDVPEELYEQLDEITTDTRPNAEITLNCQSENIRKDIFDILENLEQSEQSEQSEMAKFAASLSGDELSAVEMLVSGKNFDEVSAEFIRSRGVMLEAVIESANEKAMDFIGDIIFENGQIIEDYSEELKMIINKFTE